MEIVFISNDKEYIEYFVNYYLSLGCRVRFFSDIDLMIEYVKIKHPSIIILDADDIKGMIGSIVKIRSVSFAPCIVRAKFDDDMACLVALDAGADDYVASSVPLSVLHARIRVILRRAQPMKEPEPARHRFFADGWHLSAEYRELFRPDGSPCLLTSAEFAVLETLVHSQGVPVSRNDLLLRVFGRQFRPGDRAIDTIILKLRKKMSQSSVMKNSIKSIRNVGYVFSVPERNPLKFDIYSSLGCVPGGGDERYLQRSFDATAIRSPTDPTEEGIEALATDAILGGDRFGSFRQGVGRAELKRQPIERANLPGVALPASANMSRRELERLAALIDWASLERLLAPLRASSEKLGYPPLALFRALLVAQQYQLSDSALAEALDDRLSVRRFCGFGPDDDTPDEAVLRRFRTALTESGLAEHLFGELNDQLNAPQADTSADTISVATPVRSDQRLRRR